MIEKVLKYCVEEYLWINSVGIIYLKYLLIDTCEISIINGPKR